MPDGGVSGNRSPIRVLLADDDAPYLASLRGLIEAQPELTVVDAVADGLAAVEAAARHAPEACVLDLHMPLLDGVAAAAQLRHEHPSICLIALTGDDDPELHAAARRAGADAVLLKTAMVEALVERLAAARER